MNLLRLSSKNGNLLWFNVILIAELSGLSKHFRLMLFLLCSHLSMHLLLLLGGLLNLSLLIGSSSVVSTSWASRSRISNLCLLTLPYPSPGPQIMLMGSCSASGEGQSLCFLSCTVFSGHMPPFTEHTLCSAISTSGQCQCFVLQVFHVSQQLTQWQLAEALRDTFPALWIMLLMLPSLDLK